MTTRIRLDTPDGHIDKWIVNRDEGDRGDITLTLATDDWQVDIRLGRESEDAEMLLDGLRACGAVAQTLVSQWREIPADDDAFVTEDGGRWYVRMENRFLDERGFPTEEIALYALAEWMTNEGMYPPAWRQYGYDNTEIDDDLRALQDDAGDAMRPLEGVQFERGDDVQVYHRYQTGPSKWEQEWMSAIVLRDYGQFGVIYYFYGLESDGDFLVTNREHIRSAIEGTGSLDEAHAKAADLIARKQSGGDCDEDESVFILGYFDAFHPETTAEGAALAESYPLERDQWGEEMERGDRPNDTGRALIALQGTD